MLKRGIFRGHLMYKLCVDFEYQIGKNDYYNIALLYIGYS